MFVIKATAKIANPGFSTKQIHTVSASQQSNMAILEAPPQSPQGGRVSLGLIGIMGLIGLLCLMGEPFGSPQGGDEVIVHYSLFIIH